MVGTDESTEPWQLSKCFNFDVSNNILAVYVSNIFNLSCNVVVIV